jgi:hypothetical protein
VTNQSFRAELDKNPFVPFRVHLVSGKTIDVRRADAAWMMQHAVLIFQSHPEMPDRSSAYDIVALRNIERLEQLPGSPVV